jgi:cyclopropane fatty-acyl-phospholipid synthase-like methyltransferase
MVNRSSEFAASAGTVAAVPRHNGSAQRLGRSPEPELMLDVDQARAYAAADFASAHDAFVAHVRRTCGALRGVVVDLGCGPVDVTVRLARANPAARFVGVEGSPAMLELGRERVHRAGLSDRIRVELVHLPDPDAVGTGFDAVVSNSVLHHLADPATLWRAVRSAGGAGAPFAVMDLHRPTSRTSLDDLVARHTVGAAPRLVRDFRASLEAAYTVDEVVDQLAATDLSAVAVEMVSDRHLFVAGRLPD